MNAEWNPELFDPEVVFAMMRTYTMSDVVQSSSESDYYCRCCRLVRSPVKHPRGAYVWLRAVGYAVVCAPCAKFVRGDAP